MKTSKIKKVFILKAVPFSLICLISYLVFGCASSTEMRVSEFKFIYSGQDFILRSAYCPNNPKSCNQIIGSNFVAADLNQDRIIDEVINGEISISKAQTIYDYCLENLEKQGKVNQIDLGNSTYTFIENNITYEIKSFSSIKNIHFNQFSIKEKFHLTSFKIAVFVDNNADGKLDETLKGEISVSEAQAKYEMLIKKGLASHKLSKNNGFILSK
ncbi:MAG: hypothetical protein IPH62_06035 [Ignavibacteriae bacterium]|nr:hypothetical protein [Ignavibacteriota bacterium]